MDMDYSMASVNSYGVAQIATWSSQNNAVSGSVAVSVPVHMELCAIISTLFNFYHICINGLTQ